MWVKVGAPGVQPLMVVRGQRWRQAASNRSQCRACPTSARDAVSFEFSGAHPEGAAHAPNMVCRCLVPGRLVGEVCAQQQSRQAPFCDPQSWKQCARTSPSKTVSFNGRSPGAFHQRTAQPRIPSRRTTALVFASAAIVSWTKSSPRAEMFDRWKRCHIATRLG